MKTLPVYSNEGGQESSCFGSFAITLLDDESASFNLPVDFGHVFVSTPSSSANGLAWVRGSSMVKYGGGPGFNVLVNTELTGTTGEDGKLTISANSNIFYIENRTGAKQNIAMTFIGLGTNRI